MKHALLSLAVLLCPLALQAQEPQRFPFVLPWDDATPGVTDMSRLLDKPAGSHGFVQARDGHLFAGKKRVRFFGVNNVFGGAFPAHEAAEKIAARMAKFGIGCVRFHHMDLHAAPSGIWQADLRTLDPGQLDRLDYFIAQLKAHGIYSNLNLHVSRVYPGMPEWKEKPEFFKGVDLFYPPMLEMQRDYARQLLGHVNPYTGKAYADEPAVAFVEINNENGLICEWWGGKLDTMPESYRVELERPWNQWLQKRYASQADLEKAWNVSAAALGEELLRDGNFEHGMGGAWYLEQHEGAKATTENLAEGGLRLHVEQTAKEGWFLQFSQARLALAQGQTYTLAFRARAVGSPRRIMVAVCQAHAPWGQLWTTHATLTSEWKEYRFALQPETADADARVLFSNLGEAGTDFEFANVSLRPGGLFGLREGERLGAMPVFQKADFASRTPEAQRDWMRFLWETEEAYWTGMARFLKEEVKTHSIIVGSAAEFSTPTLQAKLDAVDGHAYWEHPHFPGKPWDMGNWIIKNISMAGSKDGGILPGLALCRVKGKPYLCTEYNAPSPNSHEAEAFLLACAFAGIQDWDALFAFDYNSRVNRWDIGYVDGFFELDQNPVKMATLPAAVAMFVRGDVPKAAATRTVAMPMDAAIDACRQRGTWWNPDQFGVPKNEVFTTALEMTDAPAAAATPAPAGAASAMGWDTTHARATVDSPRSKSFVGTGTGEPVALGEVSVAPQGWAAIALTAVDGPDFHSPGRVLICAAASLENTGMIWKNAEKNSVGKDWGKAPTLVEGVTARVTLPVAAAKLKAWALDERGQRGKAIAIQPEGKGAALQLGPEHQTLWYEVEIRK